MPSSTWGAVHFEQKEKKKIISLYRHAGHGSQVNIFASSQLGKCICLAQSPTEVLYCGLI